MDNQEQMNAAKEAEVPELTEVQKTTGGVEIHSAKSNFGLKGWLVVIFTLLIYMVTSGVPDTLNVSVQVFAGAYGWDSNAMLAMSGIGGFVGIVVSLILGLIIHKTNVKWPTVVFMFIFAALWFAYGQVNSVPAYGAVVILITAVSNTLNLVSTQQIMSNWFPRKKGIALGWATMGMCLSSAIIVPLFQALFGKGIATPFTVMCIVVIILAFITIFWFKSYPEQMGAYPDNEPISEEEKQKNLAAIQSYKSPFTIGKLLSTKQFWLIVFIFGLLFIGLVGTVAQMVPRLASIGMSVDGAILWLMIASIIGIPASYAWGAIDQKIGTKNAVVAFCVLWIISMVVAAIGVGLGSIPVSIVSIILFALGLGGLGNLMPSMAIQVFGRFDFAAANKLIVPVVVGIRSFALIIVSAVLAGAGANVPLGFRNVFILFAAISVVALVLSLLLSNKTIGKTTAD